MKDAQHQLLQEIVYMKKQNYSESEVLLLVGFTQFSATEISHISLSVLCLTSSQHLTSFSRVVLLALVLLSICSSMFRWQLSLNILARQYFAPFLQEFVAQQNSRSWCDEKTCPTACCRQRFSESSLVSGAILRADLN